MLLDMYVTSLAIPPWTIHGHYKAIRRAIEKSHPIPLKDAGKWYEKTSDLSPSTFNHRLSYLKSCFKWGIEEKLTDINPFSKVRLRKVVKKTLQPFTLNEMSQIIEAFQQDSFCPKSSAYLHSHYADFVEFLFRTGCRPSEVIGLRKKDIGFDRNEILIASVMARADNGASNGGKRVRKETKTGSQRYLNMDSALRTLLENRCQNLAPNDLIFPSPTGIPIDDRMFLQRQWKTVLAGLGIEYRKPYTMRHSLASHALESGMNPVGVAYLLGHTDSSMVMKTYGHIIHRPDLPTLDLDT
jgi:integrase